MPSRDLTESVSVWGDMDSEFEEGMPDGGRHKEEVMGRGAQARKAEGSRHKRRSGER